MARCPQCGIASPRFSFMCGASTTKEYRKIKHVSFKVHRCETCGLPTVVYTEGDSSTIIVGVMPRYLDPDEQLPERVQESLQQALNSAAVAPSGAILMCAAAVDGMLKAKDYKKGPLYERIEQAAKNHVITLSMAEWAHDVRLDANVERHADEDDQLPTPADARRSIDFVIALGEYLFVVPERVAEGRQAAQKAKASPNQQAQ